MKIRKRSRLIAAVDLLVDMAKYTALMAVLGLFTALAFLWLLQLVHWT